MNSYDICIIGAGPGGNKSAIMLSKAGKKVCIIEKDAIGGVCLNEGCIPAKNYIEAAHYIHKAPHFLPLGIKTDKSDFSIASLKNETIKLLSILREGLTNKLKDAGVDIFFDEAYFINNNTVQLKNDNKTIKAENFIIATGSSHKEHPILKIDKKFIISHKEVFELEEIPKNLLIVGAGAIGCEFANFFNALGTKVHLVEFMPNILPNEDDDISKTLLREYKKRKIKVDLSSEIISYKIENEKISIELKDKNGNLNSFSYDKILVSIGREPNTKELKLSNANIKTDERGFIITDKECRSTNKSIYAIGDVIKTPALAHVSYYESKIAVNSILGKTIPQGAVIPNVIFTIPQVSSVGYNEKTLKSLNKPYITEKIFLKSLGMPKIKGDDSGFIKLLIDKEKTHILGCSIIGYNATETINQVAICMNAKQSIQDIKFMIFGHPTMSEGFHKLIENI